MQSLNTPSTESSISPRIVLLSSILFPPLGLILLWMKRDTETDKKLLGSLGIAAFGVLYFILLAKAGAFSFFLSRPPDPETEARYTELERHRQKQREEMGATPDAGSAQPAD